MIIKIDTTNCSREEVAELKEYLEENCWKFESDKIIEDDENDEEDVKYILREDGIDVVGSGLVFLNEKIRDEELHEYSIIERETLIGDLIGWIGEGNKDSSLMREDLEMLMNWNDDYILTSNSTNSYIRQGDSDFNETCEELIELNKSL